MCWIKDGNLDMKPLQKYSLQDLQILWKKAKKVIFSF